jgi:hypothetical protein
VSGPDPIQRGPDPIREVWLAHVEVMDHTRSPDFVYAGVRHFPMGSGLIVDALEYIIFSGHVAAPEPPTWWGRVLLLAQSSHPRLGRAMVWSHVLHLYHVDTTSSYGSKGYPCSMVLTVTYIKILKYVILFFYLISQTPSGTSSRRRFLQLHPLPLARLTLPCRDAPPSRRLLPPSLCSHLLSRRPLPYHFLQPAATHLPRTSPPSSLSLSLSIPPPNLKHLLSAAKLPIAEAVAPA